MATSKVKTSLDRKQQKAFAEFVLEQMHTLSDIHYKAMFGGFGFYRKDLMFALVADENLYFKANDFLAEEFIALNLPAFVFESKGKTMTLKYYQAPEQVFEDSEHMALWADKAYQCALRNAVAKHQKPLRRKK
jgi:DNA transformation protein